MIPVTLSEPSSSPVTVEWATIAGPGVGPPAPADPGTDFEAASGTVTFAPGTTSASVSITVFGDATPEPDEWIVVSFSDPTNARMGGFWGLGFGVVVNDDVPLFDDATTHPGFLGDAVAAGDYDGDGSVDLALTAVGAQGVAVLLNDGTGGFVVPDAVYDVGRNPMGLVAADMDADGGLDLVVAGGEGVRVLRNQGDGTFAVDGSRDLDEYVRSLTVEDFDGVGALDVAAGECQGRTVYVLTNQGDGTLGGAVPYPTGSLLHDVAAADLDDDGDADLAVADSTGNTGTVSVLMNDGDGTFAARVSYDPGVPFGNVTSGLAAADLDGDGAIDLAATTSYDVVSVLYNRGDGTFSPPVTAAVGRRPDAVAPADLNGDGRIDLVVANIDSEDVTVLLNEAHGFIPHHYPVVPEPSDVAVADFDGDLQPDVVAQSYSDDVFSLLLHR